MKYIHYFKIALFLFFVSGFFNSNGQDPLRFQSEIDIIKQKDFDSNNQKKVVVFTGSSSIRMWKDVQSYFPEINAVNTGFGGSHMSDLLYFLDETVFKFNPDKVFIYEGDNDIAADKKPEDILKTTKELVAKIKSKCPDTEIVFISPKPSLARWNLKNEYTDLNNQLEKFCKNSGLEFADVWDIMLNKKGTPLEDIFIEDGLHMNKKGYDLWAKILRKYLK
ncbi:MAG: hypothetical protein JXR31_05975 [Prolixibacteraceae bacterium]|nr:hypothetical protein [Prolixibacteraceae bacterium]MBN2773776.1 hypothetical protein [Prolixibacteraceae bacterium]